MNLKSIEEQAADWRARWAAAPDCRVAHLCHDDIHIEYLTQNAEKRIVQILSEKPEEERARRLHWLGPWPGTIPLEVAEAWSRWAEARSRWDEARSRWFEARSHWAEAMSRWESTPEFQAEHDRLFPGCPWNGKTIFPEGKFA